MKRSVIAFCLLSVIAGLTSCSGAGKQEVVYVYNWGDYIDEATLEAFEAETGIIVKYSEFDSNEAMYAKIKSSPGSYDVAVPSDYMIERMVSEDMLEKIDLNNVPNAEYVDAKLKNHSYDPNNEYSVTYMWGTLGIIYNKTMVDESLVDSWDILWNPDYAKRIYMYNSQRDSMTVALKKLGHSVNTRSEAELEAAKKLLIDQKPLVHAYLTDEIKSKLINNEGALGVTYSGDAVFCTGLNEDVAFAIPKEGSNYWFDGMVIPKRAQNKENAEKFIDFMCRPEIAALNSEYTGYTTANKEALQYMPEEITSDPAFWPTDEELARCELFLDLGDFKTVYDRIWNEIFID